MNKRLIAVAFFVLAAAIAGASGGLKLTNPKPTAPAPQGWCPPTWIC